VAARVPQRVGLRDAGTAPYLTVGVPSLAATYPAGAVTARAWWLQLGLGGAIRFIPAEACTAQRTSRTSRCRPTAWGCSTLSTVNAIAPVRVPGVGRAAVDAGCGTFCARGCRPAVRCLVGLLAIACMAGCIGESWPPPRSPSNSSTPGTLAAIDADDIRVLLARPLVLPTVAAGRACPVTPARMHSPVAQQADARGPGRGPLYPLTFYLGEDATLHLSGQIPGPGWAV